MVAVVGYRPPFSFCSPSTHVWCSRRWRAERQLSAWKTCVSPSPFESSCIGPQSWGQGQHELPSPVAAAFAWLQSEYKRKKITSWFTEINKLSISILAWKLPLDTILFWIPGLTLKHQIWIQSSWNFSSLAKKGFKKCLKITANRKLFDWSVA